jgi:hypothetical protein
MRLSLLLIALALGLLTVAETPAPVALTLDRLAYTTYIDDPAGDNYLACMEFDQLHRLGTERFKWGVNLAELRVFQVGAKLEWLPASLFLIPWQRTGQATVTTTQDGASVETPVTYTSAALYAVATANVNHIFDWSTEPFSLENRRIGLGFLWTPRPPALHAAREVAPSPLKPKTPPPPVIAVRTHGFEVTRSLGSADRTWYVSYTTGWEK